MVFIDILLEMIILTMNVGNWFRYGQQPELFKSTWIHFVTYIRSKLESNANSVAFIWSPNSGNGYPYRGGQFENAFTKTLTDTSDPYSDYYPGDDYVDCKFFISF